jgi:hypothetical protein
LIEKVTHVSRKANQKHTLDVSSAVLVKKPVAKPHDEPGCNNDDESVMSFLTLDSSRSIGMSTYRSIGSQDTAAGSYYSQLTSREMVQEIRRNIQKGRAQVSYVTPLDELPGRALAWDGNVRMWGDSDRPKVDIVPCMQPLELILAQADDRLHREKKIRDARVVTQRAQRERVLASIQKKQTRQERYRARLEQQQFHVGWLRLLAKVLTA